MNLQTGTLGATIWIGTDHRQHDRTRGRTRLQSESLQRGENTNSITTLITT